MGGAGGKRAEHRQRRDGGAERRDAANAGTVNWTGSTLQLDNSALLSNSGLFDIKTDAALSYVNGFQPSVVNTGTWRKSAGTGFGDRATNPLVFGNKVA